MSKLTQQKWKLKDLREQGDLAISEWALDTPRSQYTATAAHYGHQSGTAIIHFAQMIGETPMNALAMAIPPASIKDLLLPKLGRVRERLDRLEKEGRLQPVEPLPVGGLAQALHGKSYMQKAADRLRVAINDDFGSLDFYKLPVVPPALIEAKPNSDLEISDVVRVLLPTSLFYDLIKQMEAVEGYEPRDEIDESGSE